MGQKRFGRIKILPEQRPDGEIACIEGGFIFDFVKAGRNRF
jgi:hypothetical protein